MNSNKNIKQPDEFTEKLCGILDATYDLLELAREKTLPPVSKDGVRTYYEDSGKSGFQVSGQYNRPSEFLQALLDMVRVMYEPAIIGTFFLNSNPSFLINMIPKNQFQLGYISLTSANNEEFSSFWKDSYIPYIEQCGYNIAESSALYAVASTGNERYGLKFLEEIMATLKSGFSADEAFRLIASAVNNTQSKPEQKTHTGYCFDPALDGKIRLSLWFFI